MDYSPFERLSQDRRSAVLNAGISEFSACSYADANTDRITAACGISKGLLYHYFGTKKNFYVFCAEYALSLLTRYEASEPAGDFYDILFSGMEQKMRLYGKHSAEIRFVNHVSREGAAEVAMETGKLLTRYSAQMQIRSRATLTAAVETLRLKVPQEEAVDCLQLYTNAVMNRYLARFQNEPESFFNRQSEIKAEIRRCFGLMLYGICEEEKK